MRVMPASSAAWIVAIERLSSGRPSMLIGMPPSPIAPTCLVPMVRVCIRPTYRLSGPAAPVAVTPPGGPGRERRDRLAAAAPAIAAIRVHRHDRHLLPDVTGVPAASWLAGGHQVPGAGSGGQAQAEGCVSGSQP